MIIDLPGTTTNDVNKRLVKLRDEGGAVALGRVLTLVIDVGDRDEQFQAPRAPGEGVARARAQRLRRADGTVDDGSVDVQRPPRDGCRVGHSCSLPGEQSLRGVGAPRPSP